MNSPAAGSNRRILTYLWWCLGLVAAAMLMLVGPAAARPSVQGIAPTALLPDLDQDPIRHLILMRKRAGAPGTHFRLGFDSAASNVGDGPLLLHGVRPPGANIMRADQLVRQTDGRLDLLKGVGGLRFIREHDHQHWHFLDFERYELRDDRTMELVARDRKSGFCLGDRYRSLSTVPIPKRVRTRVYGDNCGLHMPRLTGIFEGISPGWGDRYVALLEGQYVDVTHVPTGTYQLVNRVNPQGALRERTLNNNAATDRIIITWPHGHDAYPTVRIVGVCPATFGCVGPWADGHAPIPSDLVGTPFGDTLAATATPTPSSPQEEPVP